MRSPGDHLGDLLSALLDGELSASEEAEAARHLDACARCTAELEDVRTARTWVRHLPAVEPPVGFFEGMLRQGRYVAPAARRQQLRRQVAAVAASAVAAVALLGLVPPREAPVSPPVHRLVEAHAAGASVGSDPLSRLAPIGVPVTFRR